MSFIASPPADESRRDHTPPGPRGTCPHARIRPRRCKETPATADHGSRLGSQCRRARRTDAIARARLTIDLDAIAANWRALDALSGSAVETAAVVKADAYGLGAGRVGPALRGAGVRSFFVALAEEGASLRDALGIGASDLRVRWPDARGRDALP